MRKKAYVTMAAAGMAGLMLMLSGCSGQASGETMTATTVAESESQTEEESRTEEESANQTEAESESQAETVQESPEAGAAESMSGSEETEMDVSVPVHIWGAVISAGEEGILVDNQSDNSSQGEMMLTTDPNHTVIVDAADGLPVELSDIRQGSFEAYLGPAMTMSLPPQVTPYVVIVNIPEDGRAPLYAVTAEVRQAADSGMVLIANDDTEYILAENAEIAPYLTRNIVTLDDIREGSRVLMWLNEEDKVVKIVLFAD